MKKVLVVGFLCSIALGAQATLIVNDPTLNAQTAGNQLVDLAKYTQTAIASAQTQLNTLATYENTVLQVARFGNPAALRNIPGVSTVAELYQMYGQIQGVYAKGQALMNPSGYQSNLNSILSTYQLPNYSGYTAANGLPMLPGQGMFQFPVSSYNIAQNTQQQLEVLAQKRQQLQQQRDQALSLLQSATDASQVAKYKASVDALNASIAEVSQLQQELMHQTAVQNQQLQAGHAVYQASQTGQIGSSIFRAADQEMQLPSNSFHQTVPFPQ
jgi:hypothetical protein